MCLLQKQMFLVKKKVLDVTKIHKNLFRQKNTDNVIKISKICVKIPINKQKQGIDKKIYIKLILLDALINIY